MSDRLVLVLASVISPCCGACVVSGCPPRNELRCGACGHRVPRNGVPPRPSRSLPPWTWPGELAGRKMARSALTDTTAAGPRP